MKTKYEHERLNLLPESLEEEEFCKDLIRRMIDSNILMGWYGDVEFDGKETSGYVITDQPTKKE